jgi:hypothetical protein
MSRLQTDNEWQRLLARARRLSDDDDPGLIEEGYKPVPVDTCDLAMRVGKALWLTGCPAPVRIVPSVHGGMVLEFPGQRVEVRKVGA